MSTLASSQNRIRASGLGNKIEGNIIEQEMDDVEQKASEKGSSIVSVKTSAFTAKTPKSPYRVYRPSPAALSAFGSKKSPRSIRSSEPPVVVDFSMKTPTLEPLRGTNNSTNGLGHSDSVFSPIIRSSLGNSRLFTPQIPPSLATPSSIMSEFGGLTSPYFGSGKIRRSPRLTHKGILGTPISSFSPRTFFTSPVSLETGRPKSFEIFQHFENGEFQISPSMFAGHASEYRDLKDHHSGNKLLSGVKRKAQENALHEGYDFEHVVFDEMSEEMKFATSHGSDGEASDSPVHGAKNSKNSKQEPDSPETQREQFNRLLEEEDKSETSSSPSPEAKPRKRNAQDLFRESAQGSSCHQCKSRRPNCHLARCTNSENRRNAKIRRACRKKYCDVCLGKFYRESFPLSDDHIWVCPACRGECVCAACKRYKLKNEGGTSESEQINDGKNSPATMIARSMVFTGSLLELGKSMEVNKDITSTLKKQAEKIAMVIEERGWEIIKSAASHHFSDSDDYTEEDDL